MIPVKVFQGQLFDKDGNAILPDCEGIVHIIVEGKPKKFVYEKLISYLERNPTLNEKTILRLKAKKKEPISKKYNYYKKKGNVGHHRRKQVVFSKEGKEREFKSIIEASLELKISRVQIFEVLKGKRETFHGYKIKYL